MYLKAYQNGSEARRGIGAYLAFYNQERPHQALDYQTPGQVFQDESPGGVYWNTPEHYHPWQGHGTFPR